MSTIHPFYYIFALCSAQIALFFFLRGFQLRDTAARNPVCSIMFRNLFYICNGGIFVLSVLVVFYCFFFIKMFVYSAQFALFFFLGFQLKDTAARIPICSVMSSLANFTSFIINFFFFYHQDVPLLWLNCFFFF